MRTRYTTLMTIFFAGICLTACEQELNKETSLEVGVATNARVRFDGQKVTVSKGVPVTFNLDGDPDFISFFSGEVGHEYRHRNRTEMLPEDVKQCDLSFSVLYDYGTAQTIDGSTHILLSDRFGGLSRQIEQDREAVTACPWIELVERADFPQAPKKPKSYTCPLAGYLGKELTFAFRLHPLSNSGTMPVLHIKGLQLILRFNNGTSTTLQGRDFGFSAFNAAYNLDDLAKNKGHLSKLQMALGNKNLSLEEMKSPAYTNRVAYATVDGSIPYFWRISQPTDFVTAGGSKNYERGDSWLISRPILLNGACNPDTGTAVKNLAQSVRTYTHTYEKAGTYTATFVAQNANYEHQGQTVVREVTVEVVE